SSSVDTANGVATVSLTSSSNAARATVTASSGGVTDSTSVTFVDVTPSRVTVKSSRSQIQANGTDQTTITATVLGSNGSPVDDGTTVNCVTSAGTLNPTAPTTLNGIATTTLTSATFETTAQVVCTAGSVHGSVNVKFVESNTGEISEV